GIFLKHLLFLFCKNIINSIQKSNFNLYLHLTTMNRCIDCGKEFDPNQPGSSSLRGPVCNKKHLESWVIPDEVSEVLKTFDTKKIPVYLVGGSVRDYLLGRKIKDYDLVT